MHTAEGMCRALEKGCAGPRLHLSAEACKQACPGRPHVLSTVDSGWIFPDEASAQVPPQSVCVCVCVCACACVRACVCA